ncbi:MAG TPA: hypothetical protein VHP35_05435, partial [Terriglobia bacterium]|nr:hypothetical protein [Terriglobia bacterium]
MGLLACFLFGLHSLSTAAESYKGSIVLPIDLYTPKGVPVPKGKHEIEIRVDKDRYFLAFHSDGKADAVITGQQIQADLFNLPATIPIVGTHYLRSSADPIQTAQERQFSKTGLPQYAEETREWKATVRVYKEGSGSVFMVFQIRDGSGKGKRVDFELSSNPVA